MECKVWYEEIECWKTESINRNIVECKDGLNGKDGVDGKDVLIET